MTSEETILLQKKWLHNLTDGTHTKITGDLASYFNDDQGLRVGYCVMGVAGSTLGHSIEQLRGDDTENSIGEEFGLPERVVAYLVCMNDGADLFQKYDPINYSLSRKRIRATKQQRSFEFIERWLEIYFALERKRESQL